MTTYDKKRVVAGIVLVALVAAAANWHFEFVVPRFAQLIMAVIVTIGVCLYPFRPTRRDIEEHSRLTDLSEYKKSPEGFPEALLARREPGASARARPEWAFVLGAWVIAAVLPIMFEVRGTRASDSVTFLVVGGVYIAFSCYLGIKARRQGSKKGFVLKFIVPVVLVGLSTLFVALCNIFLGTAFWTAFS